MTTFILKVWTGPRGVKEIAAKMKAAGFANVSEGTEHVYFTSEGHARDSAGWDAQVDLERALFSTAYRVQQR